MKTTLALSTILGTHAVSMKTTAGILDNVIMEMQKMSSEIDEQLNKENQLYTQQKGEFEGQIEAYIKVSKQAVKDMAAAEATQNAEEASAETAGQFAQTASEKLAQAKEELAEENRLAKAYIATERKKLADTNTALTAIGKAIATVQGGLNVTPKSFLQYVPTDKYSKVITALTQQDPVQSKKATVDNSDNVDQIVTVLTEVKDQIYSDLKNIEKNINERQFKNDVENTNQKNVIKVQTQEKDEQTAAQAKHNENAAAAAADLESATREHNQAEKSEAETRSVLRAAIAEHKRLLTELADQQQALNTATSMLEVHAKSVNAEATLMQKSAVSFVSLQSKITSSDVEKVSAFLADKSKDLKSSLLENMSNNMKAGGLEMVRQLIRSMIVKLREAHRSETKQHAKCELEIQQSNNAVDKNDNQLAEETAARDAASAKMQKHTEEAQSLSKQEKELRADQDAALATRTAQNIENTKNIEENNEAAEAIDNAHEILAQQFRDSDTNAANSGWSRIDVLLQQAGDDCRKASQDFTDVESEQKKNHYEADVALAEAIAETSNRLGFEENHASSEEQKMNNAADHLKEFKKSRVQIDSIAEGVKASCVQTGLSYDERKLKREAEITALKEAEVILVAKNQ